MGAFLKEPITTKKIEKYQHKKLRAFSIEMQGWRKHMEDAILYFRFDKDTFLFAVFDGHGGAEVAQFCSNHIADELSQNNNFKEGKFQLAFKEVFQRLDEMMDSDKGEEELRNLTVSNGMQPFADGKVADSVGCTANIVLISNNTLVVANTGDSRAALSRNGKIVELSKDHKPEDPEEEKRIIASGAKIDKGRINSHLNLSRCLGDLHYKRNAELPPNKQTVICEPDITTIELCKEDEFVLMGCDGVWERHEENGQELITRVRTERYNGRAPEDVLIEMFDSFLAKDPKKEQLGCDNMSCILIQFNKLML